LDPSLSSPLVCRCCKSPSPPPLTTRAPPPPRTPPSSRLLRTSPLLHRSGKPPLPPPCQAHVPGFPGACIVSPAVPCPTASLGWPHRRDRAERGDRAGECVGRAALAGSAALPRSLGQAGPKSVGQSAAQHCAPRFSIFISFYISRKSNKLQNCVENTILIKNTKIISMESLGVYLGFRLDESYFCTLLFLIKLLQLKP
jgi:hypothetical protein